MSATAREKKAESERRLEAERVLLAAAHELLAEGESLNELSVERIAKRAGRPRTAFYLYFADKTELLMRMTETVAAELYHEAEAWWSGEGGASDMREALKRILRTYRSYDALLRTIVEVSTYDRRVGDFWREIIARFIAPTRDRFVSEGADPASAEAKAFALVWMTERSCYEHVARGSSIGDEDFVEALVEIWERSVYGGSPEPR
ncbi:TetR/AcrR family transcriptional regulator [Thermoleophilia bacterium SCSIO 60948]|nr:TetR/AcrR family transcriptional regulator [Thermoleophilia bacterium SCSIO 60948]